MHLLEGHTVQKHWPLQLSKLFPIYANKKDKMICIVTYKHALTLIRPQGLLGDCLY